MKKFTFFTLCALLGTSAGAVELPSRERIADLFGNPIVTKFHTNGAWKSHRASQKASTDRKSELKMRAQSSAVIWRACTQKAYGWTGDEWELEETYTITYNGQMLAETRLIEDVEGYRTLEENTWNENKMLAERISKVAKDADSEFVNSSKLTRTYDPVVTSFITGNEDQLWVAESWYPMGNCYTQTVTRNSDGNVTLMERAVLFNGEYDPTYRLTIEYGSNGQPSSITESELTYDYATEEYSWEQTVKYIDIEWESCNGQILSTEELMEGENRIKKCKAIFEEDGEESSFDISVTYYDGANFKAVASMTFVDLGMVFDYTSTYNYNVWDLDCGHDTHEYVSETLQELKYEGMTLMSEKETEIARVEENGLVLLEKVEVQIDDEDPEIEGMMVGEVEYDETHDYPLSWTVSEYDYESEEMIPTFRAEYSDYMGTMGMATISDINDAEVRYYNLQGIEVKNPASGIYIRMQGNRSEKVRL